MRDFLLFSIKKASKIFDWELPVIHSYNGFEPVDCGSLSFISNCKTTLVFVDELPRDLIK